MFKVEIQSMKKTTTKNSLLITYCLSQKTVYIHKTVNIQFFFLSFKKQVVVVGARCEGGGVPGGSRGVPGGGRWVRVL